MKTYWMWELPETVEAPVAVIDVFGATTNIATFLARGCKKLVLVDEETMPVAVSKYPSAIRAGESNEIERSYFQIPNAPASVAAADVLRKTVVYMSINGTRAIKEALKRGAPAVVAASFVNIDAVVSHLKKANGKGTLILSGDEGTQTVEDKLCAQAIKDLLRGKNVDWAGMEAQISAFMASFYGPSYRDNNLATILNRNAFSALPLCQNTSDNLIEASQ